MNFDINYVGYVAGFLSAISQFPQAYKVIKSGETKSISVGMYSIMTLGILFWLIYGILLVNWPMIFANGICIIPSIYILYITFRNILAEKQV